MLHLNKSSMLGASSRLTQSNLSQLSEGWRDHKAHERDGKFAADVCEGTTEPPQHDKADQWPIALVQLWNDVGGLSCHKKACLV